MEWDLTGFVVSNQDISSQTGQWIELLTACLWVGYKRMELEHTDAHAAMSHQGLLAVADPALRERIRILLMVIY